MTRPATATCSSVSTPGSSSPWAARMSATACERSNRYGYGFVPVARSSSSLANRFAFSAGSPPPRSVSPSSCASGELSGPALAVVTPRPYRTGPVHGSRVRRSSRDGTLPTGGGTLTGSGDREAESGGRGSSVHGSDSASPAPDRTRRGPRPRSRSVGGHAPGCRADRRDRRAGRGVRDRSPPPGDRRPRLRLRVRCDDTVDRSRRPGRRCVRRRGLGAEQWLQHRAGVGATWRGRGAAAVSERRALAVPDERHDPAGGVADRADGERRRVGGRERDGRDGRDHARRCAARAQATRSVSSAQGERSSRSRSASSPPTRTSAAPRS